MKTLYCDASFDWNHTNQTDELVVRGKICVAGEGLEIVESVAIGKVPLLKQYINILELIAIARAIEIAKQRQWSGSLRIITDSQVAKGWAHHGTVNKKVLTDAHANALEYLARVKKEFDDVIDFQFVGRDMNPAGHLLQAELDAGKKPHDI